MQEPFDRLVRAVDGWSAARGNGDTVFAQIHERAKYRPTSFEWVAKLDPKKYADRCREAKLIISHAGMGSIISAMSLQKPLVIVPRREHLGEQRSDHQYATAKRFANQSGIIVAMTDEELSSVLDQLVDQPMTETGVPLSQFGDAQLLETIREFIRRDAASS